MTYTYTVPQLLTKARSFAATAKQQTTTAAANNYLSMANCLADCVLARSEDVNVVGTLTWMGLDATADERTTLLMNADAALVNADAATGQAQVDYLTEAQLWSKLAYSIAVNTMIDRP